jgi:enediyne biosynthesis protein E4
VSPYTVTCLLCLALVLTSYAAPLPRESAQQTPTPPGPLTFTDVTGAAGISFKHNSGAFGKKFLPETMGSGVAFLDVDTDGWQDLLFVNSMDWPGHAKTKSYPALYRNNKNGTFTDITRQAGLMVEMYGLGVAAADYDNDGDIDIYLTALGPNRLFRNMGSGKFVDVTAKAGVGDPGFSASALWFDYDRDGRLDLYVTNYVEWSLKTDIFCALDGKAKSYCTPEAYKGQSPSFYRNNGDGTFENATRRLGLYDPASKALGVAMLDYNNDGFQDLFVANDTQPNRLYQNKAGAGFVDAGIAAGVAFNDAGVARAGMGVDAADYDGTGRESLVIGNFSNEMIALYTNEGRGLFVDEAPTSAIGKASLLTLTFACFFFDVDLDGLMDIFAANGHVADDISAAQPRIKYAQAPHLFRNLGSKKFESLAPKLGAAFGVPVVGRGAAYGDYDNDGDLDLVITENNGPARLLRNDGGNRNHALRVTLIGTTSNRGGLGARVRATTEAGAVRWTTVKSGSSYCSQSELPVTLGLGSATNVTSIEVTWPNGRVERLPGTQGDQAVTIQEGKGIVRTVPIRQGS